MICYNCKTDNDLHNKFCKCCGADLKHRNSSDISLILFVSTFFCLVGASIMYEAIISFADSVLEDVDIVEFLVGFMVYMWVLLFESLGILFLEILAVICLAGAIGSLVAFIVHYALVIHKYKCRTNSRVLAICLCVASSLCLGFCIGGFMAGEWSVLTVIWAIPPVVISALKIKPGYTK